MDLSTNNAGLDVAELEALAIPDHTAAINSDIARLKDSPIVPNALEISAYLYDVEDGHLHTIVSPKPLSEV